MKFGWVLLAGIFLAGDVVRAQTHPIDINHAEAIFWIRPAWLKRIEGRFPVLEGWVVRNLKKKTTYIDVRIDVRALQMARPSYVTWAQSAEFFDVESHPWIHYVSEPISFHKLKVGGAVKGQVTLRGITQPVIFNIAPSECDVPGIDCPVYAAGEVKRTLFGMDARKIVLGETVHLQFAIAIEPDPIVDDDNV